MYVCGVLSMGTVFGVGVGVCVRCLCVMSCRVVVG
jgi:hypothetical protein